MEIIEPKLFSSACIVLSNMIQCDPHSYTKNKQTKQTNNTSRTDGQAYIMSWEDLDNTERLQEIVAKHFENILNIYEDATLSYNMWIKMWTIKAGCKPYSNPRWQNSFPQYASQQKQESLLNVDITDNGDYDFVSCRYGTHQQIQQVKNEIESLSSELKVYS